MTETEVLLKGGPRDGKTVKVGPMGFRVVITESSSSGWIDHVYDVATGDYLGPFPFPVPFL